MGNQDVCKNKCDSKISHGSAEVNLDNVEQRLPSMNLGKSDDDDDEEEEKDDDRAQVDFVQILPMEVIEEIFLYLSPHELAACTSVSSHWREAVNSNKVWAYQCERRGWKHDFDPNFSHFYKAHKQFRRWTHSYDSFTPICQKRFLYNKHSCLQTNWRHGKYVVHKISATNGMINLFDPVSCDGKYLVTQEKSTRNVHSSQVVDVWNLDGAPTKLCNLTLPFKVMPVDGIAFDHETIVIAQSWVIAVYLLKYERFEKAYEIKDLLGLEPKSGLSKDMKRLTPYLKVTEETIVCVPSHSHSTVDFIPISFWERLTGKLRSTLNFDSMYYTIPHVVWFQDSCYLSLSNKKLKAFQIVEVGIKSEEWGSFSQSVTVEVEKIVVSKQYILAVTKTSNQSLENYFTSRHDRKQLWLWDRATGSALKSFEVVGKCFQFVEEYLMFFDSEKVTVMNPRSPNLCSEFEVQGTISSIRAASHPSIMLIIKNGPYIEVWDWGLGSRLYTITTETGFGSQLWCDDKRIITYHPDNGGTGILVLGFW